MSIRILMDIDRVRMSIRILKDIDRVRNEEVRRRVGTERGLAERVDQREWTRERNKMEAVGQAFRSISSHAGLQFLNGVIPRHADQWSAPHRLRF